MPPRLTRSQTREQAAPKIDQLSGSTASLTLASALRVLKATDGSTVMRLVNTQQLDRELSRMPKKDLTLLRDKQRKLGDVNAQVPTFVRTLADSSNQVDAALAQSAAATLVFAWEAAGTAVCISPRGLLLTCSHCIAMSEDEYEPTKEQWLLFASGDAVRTRCVVWDPIRDLALLQITMATVSDFPYVQMAAGPPIMRTALICIGHPGSEDFEATKPGVATGYDVLHFSEGRFRGLAKGQDPQDNSEIGALMHDCWTYWGHSGAPLVSKSDGGLIGLHSSWDEETGMRRGIAWQALAAFLTEHTTLVEQV